MNTKTIGFILIFIGILFFLHTMDVADFGDIIHRFWPLILIFVGINMLLKFKKSNDFAQQQSTMQATQTTTANVPPPMPPQQPVYTYTPPSVSVDSLNVSEVFGEISLPIASQNFRGGRVSNVFGEIKIDLTKTILVDGDSVLDISTVFGAITLLVPREMAFAIQSNVSVGDIRVFDMKRDGLFSKLNFKTSNFDSSPKRLHIVTSSVFGECKVW